MEYAKLGNTGMTVSRICMGCMSYGDGKWRKWTIGEDEAREHFALALESGITVTFSIPRMSTRLARAKRLPANGWARWLHATILSWRPRSTGPWAMVRTDGD